MVGRMKRYIIKDFVNLNPIVGTGRVLVVDEAIEGDWCKFEDVSPLLRENEELRAENLRVLRKIETLVPLVEIARTIRVVYGVNPEDCSCAYCSDVIAALKELEATKGEA
jgi:hypothetical protein